MINDLVTQTIVQLFEQERFYAELVLEMNRVITNGIPTMGVCVRDKIELHINPKFFESMSPKERIAVLKHECGHILNDHIPRFKELAPEVYNKSSDIADRIINNVKHKSMNIAADCALNCNIANLPEDCMLPSKFDLKGGETFEWYHENLKNNEKMKNMTGFDDHSIWSESEGDREILKEKIRQSVETAANKTRAAGKMTNDDELLVSRLNKPKNWRAILRQFAAKHMTSVLESTKKKRNRRYGINIPGHIKTEELHLGVAIDTSGSVSDEALNQFMSEIGNIAKYAKVTVVEADSEIKNSYVFDPKKTYKVKGRGGTAYKPAFDFFNDKEVDGVIYFGDMDCYDTEDLKKPKYSVLWAIIGNQEPPANWGSKVKIEIRS